MCVAMVIIYKKTLEKKAVDDVTSKQPDFGPTQAQTMSQGTTLFSCGLMERSRWHQVMPGCATQQRPVEASLESLWDVLPEAHGRRPARREPGVASGAITSLLQDLSLAEEEAAASASSSAAPPSKRQCRSLSCSDEPGAWRPQGSRLWTSVEKRRCHSGGSVATGGARGGGFFPAMQRSSSFSLPAFTGLPAHPYSSSSATAPPLYLSHEHICPPEPPRGAGASPPSSAGSTPEVERRLRGGGLARSRSQPCVLNDKKAGMKRRRPDEPRPSLDLAKMTQKLRNFHSLSCPGIPGEDGQSNQALPILRNGGQCDADFVPVSEEGSKDIPPRTKESRIPRSSGVDRTIEELQRSSPDFFGDVTAGTTNGKDREPLWAGLCSIRKDMYQLGGELDIEQIERN